MIVGNHAGDERIGKPHWRTQLHRSTRKNRDVAYDGFHLVQSVDLPDLIEIERSGFYNADMSARAVEQPGSNPFLHAHDMFARHRRRETKALGYGREAFEFRYRAEDTQT